MLRILSAKKKYDFYSKMIGKDFKALFESENNGVIKGFTENYIRVEAKNNSEFINNFVEVKLKEVYQDICTVQ